VNVEVIDINETRKDLKIEVEADVITKEEQSILKQVSRQADVKGFRKGKAPAHLLKAKYAKAIKGELDQNLSQKALKAATEKCETEIVTIVGIEGNDFVPGQSAEVTLTVDIKPAVTVPDISDLALEEIQVEATDEEVEQTLQHLINDRSTFEPVERAAKKGDFVKCSYEGKVGDELVSELVPDVKVLGSQKSTWEEAGPPKKGIPSVAAVLKGLVGMAAGDEKDVEEKYPKKSPHKPLAGKTATYHITVEEVREKIPPEMNEEFFKSLEVEDEEHLRKGIRENIENQKKQQRQQTHRNQITETLCERVEFPIPQSVQEEETQSVLQDLVNINHRKGVSEEEMEEHKEEMHSSAHGIATKRIKTRYILQQYAKDKAIEVGQNEIQNFILQEAVQRRQDPREIVKNLQKEPGAINEIATGILLEKSLHDILHNLSGGECCGHDHDHDHDHAEEEGEG
jgi:trigger factor